MKKLMSLFFSILLLAGLTACNLKEDRNQMGGVRKTPANVEEPATKDENKADDTGTSGTDTTDDTGTSDTGNTDDTGEGTEDGSK